jgi:hypothetical protein
MTIAPVTPQKPNRKRARSPTARQRKTGLLTAGTITKRAKKAKGKKNDGGQEHTFYSSQDGTLMKKNLANVYKILAAQSTKNYYEFYAANQMFGALGCHGMVSTATSSTAGELPINAIDLTAVPNWINGVATYPSLYHGSLRSGAPQSVTTSTGSQGVFPVSWVQRGETFDLKVVNSTAPNNVDDCYPCEKDRLLWSDIRLQLYGALNVPMTYHVYFVQFKKAWLVPNIDVASGSGDEIAERAAFWEAMAKPLLFNPILVQDQKHMRDLKIIKHDEFHMAPASNTETLVNPHVKTVKYFERWNKLCNYAWNDQVNVSFANDSGTQVSVGERRTTVQPTERVYMLVLCESFTNGIFSNTRNGSFDIMVKSCHEKSL